VKCDFIVSIVMYAFASPHEIWTAHGCMHDQAEQHWLAAEREVLATSMAVLAGKTNPKKKPRSAARSKTARTVARAG
jgi:hypothetical protein